MSSLSPGSTRKLLNDPTFDGVLIDRPPYWSPAGSAKLVAARLNMPCSYSLHEAADHPKSTSIIIQQCRSIIEERVEQRRLRAP